MRLAICVVCLACVAPACSSSSSSSSDSGGSSGDDAAPEGSAPAGDGGGDDGSVPCTPLVNSAPAVTITQVASDPPAFQGGTVVDGIYRLTSEAFYTGDGGATGPMGTASITIQFKSGTIQVAKDTNPPTSTYAFAPTGTTYLATAQCPAGLGNIAGSYTATATTFVASLGAPGNDGGPPVDVDTFTKQ